MARALPEGEIHVHWLARTPAAGREPLRVVLGEWLGLAPDAVPIMQTDPGAKPTLAAPYEGVQFNWSHSGPRAVVAVARGVPLGIDIERTGRPRNAMALARRHYAPAEIATLEAAPEALRQRLFIAYWTAKEAVVKACGVGLGRGLAEVEVAAPLAASPRLVRGPGCGPWELRRLEPPWADDLACLAWQGPVHRVVVSNGTL